MKLMSIVALSALLGTAVLAGTGRLTALAQLPPEPPESAYRVVDATHLIKAIGWHNLAVTGGSLGANVETFTNENGLQIAARSSSPSIPVVVTGEAGYEVEWHGTGTPPASIKIRVTKSLGVVGTSGVATLSDGSNERHLDVGQIPELSDSHTNVTDNLHTVTLIAGTDGVPRGRIWIQMGDLSVTGPATQDRTAGIITFFAGSEVEETSDPNSPEVPE